jgi:hypothetical protein
MSRSRIAGNANRAPTSRPLGGGAEKRGTHGDPGLLSHLGQYPQRIRVAKNPKFRSAMAPHRVVIFISAVGCGTRPSMSMRQNRRHEIESATSRQSVS